MEEEEQQKHISHKSQSNDNNSNSLLQQQNEKTEEKETQQQNQQMDIEANQNDNIKFVSQTDINTNQIQQNKIQHENQTKNDIINEKSDNIPQKNKSQESQGQKTQSQNLEEQKNIEQIQGINQDTKINQNNQQNNLYHELLQHQNQYTYNHKSRKHSHSHKKYSKIKLTRKINIPQKYLERNQQVKEKKQKQHFEQLEVYLKQFLQENQPKIQLQNSFFSILQNLNQNSQKNTQNEQNNIKQNQNSQQAQQQQYFKQAPLFTQEQIQNKAFFSKNLTNFLNILNIKSPSKDIKKQQRQEILENLKKQKKQLGIEIFVDIDGTIFNDPSLHVAILSKIKKQSKKNYEELINNQEFLNSILETENMIRPGIKEKLLPFFEEMRKRFNFIHFSIFTSNRQMESYQKIINQLEKNLNMHQIFKSYHLASDYNEKNIKDIELVSPYKYSYIIDNNHTIKTDMVQNLIRVMTFQAPEYLSEQNRKYYLKYLSNQEIDEIIMYKNEKQVLNKNQEINHIPNQERWLNEMESIIQQINIIISDLISQDEELQLKLM